MEEIEDELFDIVGADELVEAAADFDKDKGNSTPVNLRAPSMCSVDKLGCATDDLR